MNSEYIRVFKAFSDSKRVRILELLCNAEEECACVLLDDLQISQATLSHHMKILCESGLVKCRKEWKWNYYSINDDGCEYASKLLRNMKEKRMDEVIKIMTGFYHKLHWLNIFRGSKASESEGACACSCTCKK